MKKKVVIFGGNAKKKYFKYDERAEYWMINGQQSGARFGGWGPPPDRCFNLHRYKLLKYYKYNFDNEISWSLRNPSVPIYTFDKWSHGKIKNTLAGWQQFPLDKLLKMPRGRYHCGTFDWLVAYAIYLGVREIEFHGVGLCLEAGEPISARACLEYWCGYAEGKGIKITMAKDCDPFHFYHLVKSHLTYGLDDTPIYEDRTKRGVPYDYGD